MENKLGRSEFRGKGIGGKETWGELAIKVLRKRSYDVGIVFWRGRYSFDPKYSIHDWPKLHSEGFTAKPLVIKQ